MAKLPTNGTHEGHTIQNGIVKDPGKFEGDPVWAIEAYGCVMDGGSEWIDAGEGTQGDLIEVDDSLREEWGLDATIVAVLLSHSDQGFVYVSALTEDEHTALMAEVDNYAEACDDDEDHAWA